MYHIIYFNIFLSIVRGIVTCHYADEKNGNLSKMPSKRQKKIYTQVSSVKKVEICSITHTRHKKDVLGLQVAIFQLISK